MSILESVSWAEGSWTHSPESADTDGHDLVVTSVAGSDAWRNTSYGFVHDSEHALLAPFSQGQAIEVEFTASFSAQFDQAGLFIAAGPNRWIKAGVEFADSVAQLGAVVTNEHSDWSASPVPAWLDQVVVVRASWAADAITIRAGLKGGPFQFVRLAPFSPDSVVAAGPYTCAPTRSGLTVTFHDWRLGSADVSLHG